MSKKHRPLREVSLLPESLELEFSRWRIFKFAGPDKPGVYEIGIRKKGSVHLDDIVVLYVGTSVSLRDRHLRYLNNGSHKKIEFEAAEKAGYDLFMRYRTVLDASTAYTLERRMLRTFEYAWNKSHNGPIRDFEEAVQNAKEVPKGARQRVPLVTLSNRESSRIHTRWEKPKESAEVAVSTTRIPGLVYRTKADPNDPLEKQLDMRYAVNKKYIKKLKESLIYMISGGMLVFQHVLLVCFSEGGGRPPSITKKAEA